jgi:hypothetical protein
VSAESIVDAQLQHMLSLIDEYRRDQSSSVISEARDKARRITKQAYREAREQLHQSVMQDRLRVQDAINSAQAQRDTRIRQQQQQADKTLLGKLWDLLEQELTERWQDTNQQKQWVELVLVQATAILPPASWTIYHPLSWDSKQNNFAQQVEKRIGYKPEFESDPTINAGIRICLQSTCVDASVKGLLHDRSRIESRLLAAIHQLQNTKPL